MSPLLLDTSFVLALELANDQYHPLARDLWRGFAASPVPLVTTTFIFDEVVTFIQSRVRHAKAVQVGTWLRHADSLRLIEVDGTLFDEAWDYLTSHADKTYSLTDCVSFVLMGRLGIRTALTFDRHFVQAGFEARP